MFRNPRINFKFFLSSLLFLFTLIKVYSQNRVFHNYNVEDGLGQSQDNAICQDNDGNIWIATFGGLSRFDGTKFINFTIADGLPDNYISSLLFAKDGSLWCGSANGLCRYDGNKFVNFNFSSDPEKNIINEIAEDSEGMIWVIAKKQHLQNQ